MLRPHDRALTRRRSDPDVGSDLANCSSDSLQPLAAAPSSSAPAPAPAADAPPADEFTQRKAAADAAASDEADALLASVKAMTNKD